MKCNNNLKIVVIWQWHSLGWKLSLYQPADRGLSELANLQTPSLSKRFMQNAFLVTFMPLLVSFNPNFNRNTLKHLTFFNYSLKETDQTEV